RLACASRAMPDVWGGRSGYPPLPPQAGDMTPLPLTSNLWSLDETEPNAAGALPLKVPNPETETVMLAENWLRDELWVLDTNPPHVNTPWDSLLPITPVPVHEPVTVSGKVKPPPPGPPPLAGVLSVPTGTRNPEQVSLSLTVALRVALPRSLLTTNAASGMTKQPEASVRGGCVGSGSGTKMNTERTVIFWAPPLPPGLT